MNAPDQILDNSNGNISLGVANGSRCWYHSMAWNDSEVTANVLKLILSVVKTKCSVVNLPIPPVCINVRLCDRDGDDISGDDWPVELNLDNSWSELVTPISSIKQSVVSQSLVQATAAKYFIKLGGDFLNPVTISYHQLWQWR